MITIEWVFLGQMIIGIFVILSLRKTLQMKRALDEIIKEIKEYVTFIIDEEEKEQKKQSMFQEDVKNLKQNQKSKKMVKDEAQTRLIQAVLSEYFQQDKTNI